MAVAGFLLASRHHVDFWLLFATLVGTALVIASGCVFNNYIDSDIDKKMARTRKRALVLKLIPVRNVLIFATVLGLSGFAVLYFYTNWLVVLIGVVGFVDYVVIYGYAKRHSVHSTLIGGISGAASALAGYCAASGQLDRAALIVFLIMATWQMGHFYGIAMYRYDDYKAAGIPVLPVVKGMRATKIQTMLYIVAFTVVASLLTLFKYTGYSYLFVVSAFGSAWLIKGFMASKDDSLWGKKMFLFSLIVLLVTSVMLSVGTRLP